MPLLIKAITQGTCKPLKSYANAGHTKLNSPQVHLGLNALDSKLIYKLNLYFLDLH